MRAGVTFLGHSTVLVELGGVRVLTDPVLFDRVGILRRTSSPLHPSLYASVDAVVVSHLHLDHLDLRSLRLLGPDVAIHVPAGAGAYLRTRGFDRVTELAPGESAAVGTLRITATPARHGGFRPPLGPRAMAVGYLLDEGSERVYFAGDTDIFPAMGDLAEIDLALLPVWGWGPSLGPGHLDPWRAASALRLLRPRAAVPIHWGTLWPYGLGRVVPGRLTEPPREFGRFAARVAPEVSVLPTPPGEAVAVAR